LTSWTVKNPPAYVMDKVLVVGIMEDKEACRRTEEAIIHELEIQGITASSSTDILGTTSFNRATGEEISTLLASSGYTSVMLVSFINKEKELRSAGYYGRPHYPGSHRYYRRYWTLYDTLYTPGYYNASFDYLLEVEIYTVNDSDELVYCAQKRISAPKETPSLAGNFSKSIIAELRTKGLLPLYAEK
ncbi:MAG: hypothetical protein LUD74_04875, partial [Tannerellaceae bacterium]|nr:hypothetical protein [Tannerellaceae bacterium]